MEKEKLVIKWISKFNRVKSKNPERGRSSEPYDNDIVPLIPCGWIIEHQDRYLRQGNSDSTDCFAYFLGELLEDQRHTIREISGLAKRLNEVNDFCNETKRRFIEAGCGKVVADVERYFESHNYFDSSDFKKWLKTEEEKQ